MPLNQHPTVAAARVELLGTILGQSIAGLATVAAAVGAALVAVWLAAPGAVERAAPAAVEQAAPKAVDAALDEAKERIAEFEDQLDHLLTALAAKSHEAHELRERLNATEAPGAVRAELEGTE